jgi:hypothetical protein
MKELIKIQQELKAPKNQYNTFGRYHYRSSEDILEALKPLLLKYECTLTVHDEVREVGGIVFIEATASIQKDLEGRTVTAQAGIDINRKGMDIAQSFGSSSSYARKYALNGLFLIDDTKDADFTNTHGKSEVKEDKPWLNKGEALNKAMEYLRTGGDIATIEKKYKLSTEIRDSLQVVINNLNQTNK